MEDDSPGDLAVIETRGVAPTQSAIEALGPGPSEGVMKPAGLASPTAQPVPDAQPSVEKSPDPPTENLTSLEAGNDLEPVLKPPKSSKWDSLPP